MPRASRSLLDGVPQVAQGLYASCQSSGSSAPLVGMGCSLNNLTGRIRALCQCQQSAGYATMGAASAAPSQCNAGLLAAVSQPVCRLNSHKQATCSASAAGLLSAGSPRARHALAWRRQPVANADSKALHDALTNVQVLEDTAVPVLVHGDCIILSDVVKTLQRLPATVAAESVRQGGRTDAAAEISADEAPGFISIPSARLGRHALSISTQGALLPEQQKMLGAVSEALAARLASEAARATDAQLANGLWGVGLCRLRFKAGPSDATMDALAQAVGARATTMPLPDLATAAWGLAAARCTPDKAVMGAIAARIAKATFQPPKPPAAVEAPVAGPGGVIKAAAPAPAAPSAAASAHNLEPAVVAKLAAAFEAWGLKDSAATGALAKAATASLQHQLASHDAALGALLPRCLYRYKTVRGWVVEDTPKPPRPSKYIRDNSPSTKVLDFTLPTLGPTLKALTALEAPGLEELSAAAAKHLSASAVAPPRAASASASPLDAPLGNGSPYIHRLPPPPTPVRPAEAKAAAGLLGLAAAGKLPAEDSTDLAAALLTPLVGAFSSPKLARAEDAAEIMPPPPVVAFKGRKGVVSKHVARRERPATAMLMPPQMARPPTLLPAAVQPELAVVLGAAVKLGAGSSAPAVHTALVRIADAARKEGPSGLSMEVVGALMGAVVNLGSSDSAAKRALDALAKRGKDVLTQAAVDGQTVDGAALARLAAAAAAVRTAKAGAAAAARYPHLLSAVQQAAGAAAKGRQAVSGSEARVLGKALAKWEGHDQAVVSALKRV